MLVEGSYDLMERNFDKTYEFGIFSSSVLQLRLAYACWYSTRRDTLSFVVNQRLERLVNTVSDVNLANVWVYA